VTGTKHATAYYSKQYVCYIFAVFHVFVKYKSPPLITSSDQLTFVGAYIGLPTHTSKF